MSNLTYTQNSHIYILEQKEGHPIHEDEADCCCLITASDFKVTSRIDDSQNILQIIMPKPLGRLYC